MCEGDRLVLFALVNPQYFYIELLNTPCSQSSVSLPPPLISLLPISVSPAPYLCFPAPNLCLPRSFQS